MQFTELVRPLDLSPLSESVASVDDVELLTWEAIRIADELASRIQKGETVSGEDAETLRDLEQFIRMMSDVHKDVIEAAPPKKTRLFRRAVLKSLDAANLAVLFLDVLARGVVLVGKGVYEIPRTIIDIFRSGVGIGKTIKSAGETVKDVATDYARGGVAGAVRGQAPKRRQPPPRRSRSHVDRARRRRNR